jgi:hypothetical protein
MYNPLDPTRLDRYLSTYGGQILTTTTKLAEVEAPERTKGCSQPVASPLAAHQAGELADLWRALGAPPVRR